MHIIVAFVILVLSPHLANAQEQINLTNGEWQPYQSQYLPDFGIASKIVSQAFARLDIKVVYGFYPWARSYSLAKNPTNEWKGSLLWSRREDRNRDFWFSDPIIIEEHVFFHHVDRSNTHWKSIADLKGFKVGVLLGSSAPDFERAEDTGQLTIVRTAELSQLFNMLAQNRIDIIPMSKAVGRYHVNQMLPVENRGKISFSSSFFKTQEYHLILSKEYEENKNLIRRFNALLGSMMNNGEYFQIMGMFERKAEIDISQ